MNVHLFKQVGSLAHAAKKANMVLLQYPEYLEIWRLGKTSEQSGNLNSFTVQKYRCISQNHYGCKTL